MTESFDKEQFEPDFKESKSRHSPSLFGPIVLIGLGVYFLLYNLGIVGALNWQAALALWPLLLIFLGLNIIVRQFPRPWGSLLSGLVALMAIGVFGYVLLIGGESALLNKARIRLPAQGEVQRQDVAVSADGVETAVINIDFAAPHAKLEALADNRNLLEGSVTYLNDIIVDSSTSGAEADVNLHTRDSGVQFWLDPRSWTSFGADDAWQLGINPDVVTDLHLDVGSGSVDLNLSDLTLSALKLDGGSGSTKTQLPDGNYDVVYDAASGSTTMWLPSNGRHVIEVAGSSGSMTFYLPENMEARVDVDSGSGSFRLPDDRFTQVSGSDPDEGVWQTPGYDQGSDQVRLIIDIGSGSVHVEDEK